MFIATHAKTLTTLAWSSAKSQSAYLPSSVQNTWSHQSWKDKQMHQHTQKPLLSAEEIEVRIWGFVVIAVTLILCFIVVALLYSVTFVTQPIKSMAPIDQAYTKMLNDIVLLIVGGIGGVMSKRAVAAGANALSPKPSTPVATVAQPAPVNYPAPAAPSAMPNFNWMGYQNPDLDESWTPGPPPTTPPEHLEDDHERELIALARKEAH